MPSETIFADSMLQTSWAQRTRCSWTTLTSFGLQAVIIGLLLLLPLWKTVGLPSIRKITITTPISAGYAEPAPVARPVSGRNVVMPLTSAHPIVLPRAHTFGPISQTNDDPEPLPTGGCAGCIIGDNIGPPGGPPISIFSGNHPVALPPAPKSIVREFRTSRMLEGSLIRRVQPVYPVLAKTAHIQGSVVLFAVISRSGTIDSLRVVSGHPLLVAAAVDAVKQWQYRPYILNQEPIEVETQITVNFILGN